MAAMDYLQILPSSPMLLTDPFGHPSPTDGSNGLFPDITKQSNAVDRPIWSPSLADGSNGLSPDITKR